MAELIGVTLGDGNIYNRKSRYVEYTGDPIKDAYYFRCVLLQLVREVTGKNPRLFVRDRGLRFRIFSKSFVEWLEGMGIPSGKAKGMAKAPELIASDLKLMKRCVRGVHDTDGSVYFDMRQVYANPYPRIELHMKNIDLVSQVSAFFSDIGIVHCYVKTKNSIETAGMEALAEFLKKVGFSNIHHIDRIRQHYPELVKENCCPTSLI